jgi:hypothetical protein
MKLTSKQIRGKPNPYRALAEAMEPRVLFSFTINASGTSVSASASAGNMPQNVQANPASAQDSYSYAGSQYEAAYSLSASANASYEATSQVLTLHADATQATTGGYLGWPDDSGTQSEVLLNFNLTAAATVQVDGTLTGTGGAVSNVNLDISDFQATSSSTSSIDQAFNLTSGNHIIEINAEGQSIQGTNTASVDLTMTIGGTETAPKITSRNTATFHLGDPSAFTVTTTGDPTPSITETAFLPDGVSFVDNGDGTATLSGTPAILDATGNYDLIFTASNGVAISDTQPNANQFFTLTLDGAPGVPIQTPTHLTFSQKPVTTAAGSTLPPISVEVADKTNHGVSTDGSTVTLTIAGTAGGVLNGTLTATAVNGVATFDDLSLTKAGTYTLTATDGSLKSVKSPTFTITPDTSSAQLTTPQSPAAPVLVGKPLTPISVTLEDQFGNIIKNNKTPVTLSIADGPANGTLKGPTAVHFVNGVATFKNISLSEAGSYTLQLSDGSLPGAGSVPFTLTVNVAQATPAVATPHSAHSYKTAHPISLSITIKSNAPAAIPFTGTASITDQNDNVLATVSIAANGVLHFVIPTLLPGTYVCTVNYPSDANHTAATSEPFTLNVTT